MHRRLRSTAGWRDTSRQTGMLVGPGDRLWRLLRWVCCSTCGCCAKRSGRDLRRAHQDALRLGTFALCLASSSKMVGYGRAGAPARLLDRHGAGVGGPVGWSGGWFEGDLVAEGFELADAVAFLDAGVETAVVEAGAQVFVTGVGIRQ